MPIVQDNFLDILKIRKVIPVCKSDGELMVQYVVLFLIFTFHQN